MPAAFAAQKNPLPHRLFRITLNGASGKNVSGRLLLFATPVAVAKKYARNGKVTSIDISPFRPTEVAVAAMPIASLSPGESVYLDADALAFPTGFSKLKPGHYDVQALLDVNHNYNYSGRGAGDLVSAVREVDFGTGTAIPTLELTRKLTGGPKPWTVSPRVKPKARREAMVKAAKAAHAHSNEIDFVSPALSKFWGRPIHMRGWVMLPPDYAKHSDSHYPTVYFTHGFGGNLTFLTFWATDIWQLTASGVIPPMIWVFLDESSPTGTHEFADSVNNGPWGTALTTELIPNLEAHYRMDAKPSGRFLTGHSSGGWATLWLQVRYPKIFGGTWSISPDPSDFHDFTGPNIYAANANVYYKPNGKPWPLVRAHGKVLATFKQFAQLERVLGPYGGQMASFDWVFSPRGPDGRPEQMFNRDTGAVNPKVADYWRKHYDIAYRLKTHWQQLKPDLNGKIHLVVGTADTFYLDGAAHKLDALLDGLHAKAQIVFLPGKTHSSVFKIDGDPNGLMKRVAWAMYHVAHPKAAIPKDMRQIAP
ncbi:MAG TPA: alpha/beta hydrolase-fold protein [Gammaproteobacteria bacterium]|nr:alpha/beta hydrolase-fold protein [Gammaproteobacteria bacterium]